MEEARNPPMRMDVSAKNRAADAEEVEEKAICKSRAAGSGFSWSSRHMSTHAHAWTIRTWETFILQAAI